MTDGREKESDLYRFSHTQRWERGEVRGVVLPTDVPSVASYHHSDPLQGNPQFRMTTDDS